MIRIRHVVAAAVLAVSFVSGSAFAADSLYKRVGAQYFFALANHHDNLDLWDSRYQPWNSVRVGPKKDIIGGWARAARAQGLPFGVSFHAASPLIWATAAVLLVGGFVVARITWGRVAHAWDEALSAAREKGVAA